MTKEELKTYLSFDNKGGRKGGERGFIQYIPDVHQAIVNHHNQYFNNRKFIWRQKIYNYFNDITEVPKCKNVGCDREVNFQKIWNEYSTYCSIKCTHNQDCWNKSKQTSLDTYGVDNPMKLNNIKEKLDKKNIELYGVKRKLLSDDYLNDQKEKNILKIIQTYTKKLKLNDGDVILLENENLKKIKKELLVKNLCEKHGEFIININNLRNRVYYGVENICTKCHPIDSHNSIAEDEIKNFIVNELNLNVTKHKIKNKEIDIFIPEFNVGIEFNGNYWHSDKFKDVNYHQNKTNLCEKNNIKLLQIFEDEWLNKKDIIKSIIRSKLDCYEDIINAKDCKINNVDLISSNEFLENNHIDGGCNSEIQIGLYYNHELVFVMVMNIVFEIIRHTSKLNTNIVGGVDVILKNIIYQYKPKVITTSIDRRLSQGKVFINLGFNLVEDTKPNFKYYSRKTRSRINENNKLKIYDSGLRILKLLPHGSI